MSAATKERKDGNCPNAFGQFAVDIKPHQNLGRFAAIWVYHEGVRLIVYGNVIDLVHGTNAPKRIRVQRGLPALHGEVLMPNEYQFAWWADEEED